MAFFETNQERIRHDLVKLLMDDEVVSHPPCSKGQCELSSSTADGLITESDSDDDMESLIHKTEDVLTSMRHGGQASNTIARDSVDPLDLEFEENEDAFIDTLIAEQLGSVTEPKTYIGDKPYRIDIMSSFEPDDEYDDEVEDNGNDDKEDIAVSSQVVPEYTDFDAFYEHYLEKEGLVGTQFEMFGDIILENLNQTGETIQSALQEFRQDIASSWIKSIRREYITDPAKWVARVDNILFDMHLKQTVLEYVHHLAKLLVLFDATKTFGLNEHMYVEIGNKALEPLDMKKYKLDDLLEHYTKGKPVSRTLIQDVAERILTKQNVATVNLLVKLYSMVTGSDNISPLDDYKDPETLQARVDDQLLSSDYHHPPHHLNLNRPIIYVDPSTKKAYVFDYRKLHEQFVDNDRINPYTNEEFTPEFIDMCNQKTKSHMLCVFCKDGIDDKDSVKTVYMHPKYGPIVLKFCSTTCMADQPWNNKSIQNAIVGCVL